MREQESSGIGPLDPSTKASLVVAALMVVGAVVWWINTRSREIDHEPRGKDVRRWVQSFRTEIEAVADRDPPDRASLETALQRIEHEQDRWLDRSTESDIRAAKARIETRLAELHRK